MKIVMKQRFFCVCFLLLQTSYVLANEPSNQDRVSRLDHWHAWLFRLDVGLAIKKEKQPTDKRYYIAGPMLEYGIEKGLLLDRVYLAADVTWPIFIPDSFVKQDLEPWKMWLIPITHLHLGYLVTDSLLVTVGSTYFWGLAVSIRYADSPSRIFELKYVKWLDEPWEEDWPFHQSIHDTFISCGLLFPL